jgi:hypothetical protein
MKYIEEKSLTFMSGCPQKYPSVFFLVLEQYAVKIGNSTLFLYDKILIYHDCDFKKNEDSKIVK